MILHPTLLKYKLIYKTQTISIKHTGVQAVWYTTSWYKTGVLYKSWSFGHLCLVTFVYSNSTLYDRMYRLAVLRRDRYRIHFELHGTVWLDARCIVLTYRHCMRARLG